jgi:hypothetical protein
MARRVETRGVVVTSLLIDDDAQTTSPGDVACLHALPVVGGVVDGDVCVVDRVDDIAGVAGVAVVGVPALADLPLLAAARGVVAERGLALAPVCQGLRELGIATVVEAPSASMVLVPGEPVRLQGGLVRRLSRESLPPSQPSSPPSQPSPPSSPPSQPSSPPSQPSSPPSPPPSSEPAAAREVLRDDGAADATERRARRAGVVGPGQLRSDLPSPPAAGLHQVEPWGPLASTAEVSDPAARSSADDQPVAEEDVVGEEDAD